MLSKHSQPNRIIFPVDNREVVTTLTILFSGFNDRLTLLRPLSNYNLNSRKRQKGKDIGEKLYVEKFNSFHQKHIIPFVINPDNSINIDKEKYETEKDFLKLLEDKNRRLTYISGSVGCGKSTFISHLVYFARNEATKTGRIAVISISASALDEGTNQDYEKIIFRAIEKAFSASFKDVTVKDGGDFRKVINKHFKSHRLIIVFDDLDKIYDQSRLLMLYDEDYDKEFSDHFKNKKYIHIAVKLVDIIKSLLDENANVSFIVGLRNETLNAISAKYVRDTGGETLERLRDPRIISLSHLNIYDVLKGRFEMYSELDANDISRFHDFSKKVAREFDGLHVNGTRHVMAAIRNLTPIDMEALCCPDWMVQLYLYLDGYQKYNQQDCGILNIFLVNIDYRNAIDKKNTKYPKFTKIDHYQTYWLKYFICKYFYKMPDKESKDNDIVYRDFSEYERGLFNFCMYSLTDTKHGRLISCCFNDTTGGIDDYMLEKTTRLTHCFDKEIFFSFVYLSIIVNDDFMEIPDIRKVATLANKKYADKFYSIFNKKYTYENKFFIRDDENWNYWLYEHIEKCLVFVNILEISLRYYEGSKIPKSLTDEIPNFRKINSDLESQVKEIAKTISLKEQDVNSKIKEVKRDNKKYTKLLIRFFKEYSEFKSDKSGIEQID